jgi:hypothetical protein
MSTPSLVRAPLPSKICQETVSRTVSHGAVFVASGAFWAPVSDLGSAAAEG